jgi:hypothetical protein
MTEREMFFRLGMAAGFALAAAITAATVLISTQPLCFG